MSNPETPTKMGRYDDLCIYCHRHIAAGTKHVQPEGEACCIEAPETPTVERFTELLDAYANSPALRFLGANVARDFEPLLADYLTLQATCERLKERLAESHEVIVTLRECADAANSRAKEAEAECERLRKTNTRLNRRAQSAEAAADTKAEDWNKRAAGSQLRNHYYIRAIEAEKRAEQAESDLARLRAEKEQIQAMNKGPVEQIQHIPLPRFVKTRFVHVGDCNEMIDKVTHKLTALQDAIHALHDWCDERRNAGDITTLGMVQYKIRQMLEQETK